MFLRVSVPGLGLERSLPLRWGPSGKRMLLPSAPIHLAQCWQGRWARQLWMWLRNWVYPFHSPIVLFLVTSLSAEAHSEPAPRRAKPGPGCKSHRPNPALLPCRWPLHSPAALAPDNCSLRCWKGWHFPGTPCKLPSLTPAAGRGLLSQEGPITPRKSDLRPLSQEGDTWFPRLHIRDFGASRNNSKTH